MHTDMKMWTEVRRRVLNKELSKRAACEEYSIHWDTLTKILAHVEPPGYRKAKPRSRHSKILGIGRMKRNRPAFQPYRVCNAAVTLRFQRNAMA